MTFCKVKWSKDGFSNFVYPQCFKNFCGSANIILYISLKMGNKMKKILSPAYSIKMIFIRSLKILFCFWLENCLWLLFFFQTVFSQHCFSVAQRCENWRWKWQICFDLVWRCSNQLWDRQRLFDVVQCCKFQIWRTQRCFSLYLTLCDVRKSY